MIENTILIATHNNGKLSEFREMLAPYGIILKSSAELKISEPEETGKSFAENAELKARHAAIASGISTLADDSGLVIPALGGAPGIYSARWAGEKKDFSIAFERIFRELGDKSRDAYFIAVLSLVNAQGKCINFEGRVYGKLTFPPRGENGFGYDSIFIPQGYDLTFAEMDAETKHKISHRFIAISKFLEARSSRNRGFEN